jgi:hypothetical protein
MIGSRSTTMPAMLWIHRMSVLELDPTTGHYTAEVLSDQLCRLCETSRKDAAAAMLRAEGQETRVLLYPPDLEIDPHSQIVIGVNRYQIVSGTDQAARGVQGELVYRSYDVLRAAETGDPADL